MPGSRKLLQRLDAGATFVFDSLGYSGRASAEAKRDTWWWLQARARALRARRGLLGGRAVAWTASGYAELVPIDVLRPGPGEATIEVEASAVSPGTERAHYLRLPNTAPVWIPGYSASGTIVALGSGGGLLRVGDPVAAPGVPHASVATHPLARLHPIPPGVRFESAALVQLGVICGQGVEKAELAAGERFGVVGSGAIGALALRLAAAAGAEAAAVIATSRSKEAIARAGGAREFLVAGEEDSSIAQLELPVVIEATGSPEAVNVAIAAAGEGGRIVLMGSPRGTTRGLLVDQIQAKRLRLIGAHVNTLGMDPGRSSQDAQRVLAQGYLDALSRGMEVADLVGPAVDPREAGEFYRRLVRDPRVVGAHFDWSRLEPGMRISGRSLLRAPDLRGRGVDVHGPPVRGGSANASGPLAIPDPFVDAEGELRIGMLGCGDIAIANAAAAGTAPNVRLVACFDPDQRLAVDLAERFGGAVSPSSDALLARGDLDAVFLCVPHHLHAPLAIEAAQAGKHLIVEKPPANRLEGAVAMVAAAREAEVVLSVCFPDRYEPRSLVARQVIEGGALGAITGATVKFFRDKAPSYWLGGFSGRSSSDWRRNRAQAGGGVLITNLSHYLDLLRHLTGLEVERLTAFTAAGDDAPDVEEVVSVSLRFENGAVGNVSGGSSVRGSEASEFRIWGEDGHVALEPEPRLFTLRALEGVRTSRWQAFGGLPSIVTRAAYLSRLATAIERGSEPDVTVDDALAVQAVIEAAYEAAQTGGGVRPADLLARAAAE